MSDLTIRDPYEMDKFADELDNYCIQMKQYCNVLKAHIHDAKPGMKDEFSEQSLRRIEDFIDKLLNSLPYPEEAAERLRKASKPLKRF